MMHPKIVSIHKTNFLFDNKSGFLKCCHILGTTSTRITILKEFVLPDPCKYFFLSVCVVLSR